MHVVQHQDVMQWADITSVGIFDLWRVTSVVSTNEGERTTHQGQSLDKSLFEIKCACHITTCAI